MTDTGTLYLLLPETVLIAAATIIYLMGAFFPKHFRPHLLAAGAIVVAAGVSGYQSHVAPLTPYAPWISGPIVRDVFGHTACWAILLFGLLFVLLSAYSKTVRPTAEYVGSLLLLITGLMLVATGYDLVMLFLGLELVSIPTYVLLYLGRRDASGQEATAKYFFLSILSSALLLYGFSFLYGLAGSTRLDHLHDILEHFGNAVKAKEAAPAMIGKLAPVAMLLVFAGLGFRMTAVPFHFYAPDVYQGTNNANAGLLSTLPKIAGLLVLVRVLMASMPGADLQQLGWRVAVVMAVLTMSLGNVLALWQDNIRRLLAYSSIAHGGYMLIGVAVGFATAETGAKVNGVGAALFYLGVYCLATIGAFAALNYLGARERQVDGIDELSGLGRTRPLAALALAVSMFSLAGVPPLAGFSGKLSLLTGALEVRGELAPWFVGLAVITALNAAVAMAYYLRVVATMYFRAPVTTLKAQGGPGAWAAMVICTLLVVALGILPGRAMKAADDAGNTVQQFQPIDTSEAGPVAAPVSSDPLPGLGPLPAPAAAGSR